MVISVFLHIYYMSSSLSVHPLEFCQVQKARHKDQILPYETMICLAPRRMSDIDRTRIPAEPRGILYGLWRLGVDTLLRNERRHHHQSPAGLTLLFHPHSRSEPRSSAPAGPTRHKDEATRGGRCDLSCNGDAMASATMAW